MEEKGVDSKEMKTMKLEAVKRFHMEGQES